MPRDGVDIGTKHSGSSTHPLISFFGTEAKANTFYFAKYHFQNIS